MDPESREAEIERDEREVRAYGRHAYSFAAGFACLLLGALLGRVSALLFPVALIAAGGAWAFSGITVWRGGVHMFGGFGGAPFGRSLVMKRTRVGSRIVALVLLALGLMAVSVAAAAIVRA